MTNRIRIIYLVSTLRQAGPTMQLLNIVRHLDRHQFDPLIATLSIEPADSLQQSFETLGVRVKSLSLSRARGMLPRNWRDDIRRLSGQELDNGCVIHSQGIRADMISSKAFGGVARIATARNYPYDDYVMKFGRMLGGWMARRHLRAFRAIPSVVACSSTLARQLRNHGVEATVIRNGVETARFSAASPAERARLRLELGLPESVRAGLCVSSLVARKNPLSVVRATRTIDSPDLMMIFVGTGALEAQCRRAAEGDLRIRFAGHLENVLRHLQAADFFVSASRSEGMPNAVMEALACGLPLVLSDIEPHRELLELAPSAGTLFGLDDPAALADAIQRVLSPSTGIKSLLPGQGEEILGARQVSRRYQEIYLRLVRQASAA